MKRIVLSMLVLLLLLIPGNGAFAAAPDQMQIISRSMVMPTGSTTAKVISIDGTTMLPLDDLIFFMGWSQWKPADSAVYHFGPSSREPYMVVYENTARAVLNGQEITLPISTFTYQGRNYVPLSYICTSMGYSVTWRQADQTIYIQSSDNYTKAGEITGKSLAAVGEKTYLTTKYENKTGMHYYGDQYTLETKGTMKADFAKNTACSNDVSNLYNERFSTYHRTPEDTYTTEEYVTAEGIYRKSGNGYTKEPVPLENISTMDMASKSVFTDPQLFLTSASVRTDENGDYVIKAQTDVGVLIKVGYDIYIPEQAQSLDWSNTYQTVTYDKNTYLPKRAELSLHATCVPNPADGEKMLLTYNYIYEFDFSSPVSITLPAGVK